MVSAKELDVLAENVAPEYHKVYRLKDEAGYEEFNVIFAFVLIMCYDTSICRRFVAKVRVLC